MTGEEKAITLQHDDKVSVIEKNRKKW